MDLKKIDVKLLFFFRKIKTKKINVDQKRTSKKQMKNTRAEYNAHPHPNAIYFNHLLTYSM